MLSWILVILMVILEILFRTVRSQQPNVEQPALKIDPVMVQKRQHTIRNMDISEITNNNFKIVFFVYLYINRNLSTN